MWARGVEAGGWRTLWRSSDLNSLDKEGGRNVTSGCVQNTSGTPADLEERERMVGGKGQDCKEALLR